MANSRLIQMYGFAEADNPHDDVHITKATITETITALGVDAHEAKIKLLDSLGFFDEVRVSGSELEDTFRAVLAVASMARADFTKMVKATKKKAKGAEIEELEVEIESNHLDDLNDLEKQLFREMMVKTKDSLKEYKAPTALNPNEKLINEFVERLMTGSLKLIELLLR